MLQLPDLPGTSVTQRIFTAVRTAISDGRYKPGDKLPARLALAKQLGVNARTVGGAYSRLEMQGLVVSRVGSGTYVSDDAARRLHATRGGTGFDSITIVAGETDLASCTRDPVRVLTDIIAGIRDVLGDVKIDLVESFNEACLGDLASDDAVVVYGAREIDPVMARELAKRDVPVIGVWGRAWTDTLGGLVGHVDYDRPHAARLACEHLLACGYRRIGFIGDMGQVMGLKFFEFTNALFRANLDYQVRHVRDVDSASPGAAYRAATQIVRDGDMPDAFFVDTDYKAMEVVAALNDAGLKVPGDVGVVGYDDVPEAASWCDPPLTTVRTPRRDIGRRVADMLQGWKQNKTPLQSELLAPELMVRGTTRTETDIPKPRRSGPRGVRAFTLIELLVVISILSLLMAILLPALEGARAASQKIVSLSNVRQISVSLNTYAADNLSSMPYMEGAKWTGSAWVDSDYYWSQRIVDGGYLGDVMTFWSPQRKPQTDLPSWQPYRAVGYGLNIAVAGYEASFRDGDSSQQPLHLNKGSTPPPSKMVLLAETWNRRINYHGYFEAHPFFNGHTSDHRLYNYAGGVVRSYLDGRAHAAGAVSSGTGSGPHLVSGKQSDVDGGSAPVDPDELGWRWTWPSDSNISPSPSHAGDWAFSGENDYEVHAPWYVDWRTRNWFNGLR